MPMQLQMDPINSFYRHQDEQLHATGEAFLDFFKVVIVILIVGLFVSRLSH